MNKRNIAIIAHVDHGKTTLVNGILKTVGKHRDNEDLSKINMDSNAIEQERGITILSKTTGIDYKGYHINIVDTPGHADFGGEVERIMNMIDGIILVVDAYEGVMPQTKFVLKKAMEANAKPIVVINKVDKPSARCAEVLDEILELFLDYNVPEEYLDFPVVYASAINETCSLDSDLSTQEKGFTPLLDLIIKEMPEPKVNLSGSFLFQPALIDYNDYVGRMGVGLVRSGKIKVGNEVENKLEDGTKKRFRIQKIFTFDGMNKKEMEEVEAGDICAIAGLADIEVGDTVCLSGDETVLPRIKINKPTLQMVFSTNSSPFSGLDGTITSARKLADRLNREMQKDVSLEVTQIGEDSFIVAGRGELHLGILIENMRREGFELEVSKPKVIEREINGVISEPFEELEVECPGEYSGGVIEALAQRGAEMLKMGNKNGNTILNYLIPSRGLLGFSATFMTLTRGYGIMNHNFKEYLPKVKINVGERNLGVMLSIDAGKATAYAMEKLENRGTLFIEPGTEVYEGMIVGEHLRENDLIVNITKGKNLTNVRAAGSDHTVVLKRPRKITLEYALDYINDDELLEITPHHLRMRKKILDAKARKKDFSRN